MDELMRGQELFSYKPFIEKAKLKTCVRSLSGMPSPWGQKIKKTVLLWMRNGFCP